MASGHVNRANRPNTWLLRPDCCTREKSLASPEPSTHDPELPLLASNESRCDSTAPRAAFFASPHCASLGRRGGHFFKK
jgi:hypothetical protein